MIIDVRKLNAQKSYEGDLVWEEEADESLVDIPYVEFDGKIEIQAHYELYEDNSLQLTGKVFYKLKGKCSRCLSFAEKSIEGEINALFEPFSGAEDYSYSRGIIDTQEAIKDAVVFSMPMVLLCKDDCAGIQYD